jgi:hypothetical protein
MNLANIVHRDALRSIESGVFLPAMTEEAPTESLRLDAELHQRPLAACAEPV